MTDAAGGPSGRGLPGVRDDDDAQPQRAGTGTGFAPGLAQPAPTAAQAKPAFKYKRKYRPVDVRSWHEGALVLIGWILVIVLAVATGGLMVMYELLLEPVADRDFRDLYLDQRLTNYPNNLYHKNFLLAQDCCNTDPVFFAYASDCSEDNPNYYMQGAPYCKPIIVMECADIRSAACNSTRAVLYPAAGLSATGQYVNCRKAGYVRVGAETVAAGRPVTLVAYYQQAPTGDTLVIQSPFNINVTQVQEFVNQVAASVPPQEVAYIQPNHRLSLSVYLHGQLAELQLLQQHAGKKGLKAPYPWKSLDGLWPFPGSNQRCPNSRVNVSYYLGGGADVLLPRFTLATPQASMMSLQVANDSLLVPAWNVSQVDNDDEVGGSNQVTVSYLTSIQFMSGQAITMSNCYGWLLSRARQDLVLGYSLLWTGTIQELQAGLALGPVQQFVSINFLDEAGPRLFQLPPYGGMWYIMLAFGPAGIWLFGTGLILLITILVWWNIRSNKGLPPIIYRYMQKYRGW